ncbi:MAG: PKD domain-containing protein [Cyclobacteriaceae bacterium]
MKIDFSNTEKLLFQVFIGLVFFMAFLLQSYGQVLKPFLQRTAANSTSTTLYQIKGDFTMIGNTSMTLENYNLNLQNNNSMVFVDVDNDQETFNSSSAILAFSTENGAQANCTNILFAGLYWTGRSSPDMDFEVMSNGKTKYLDKREVKIKTHGSSGYELVRAKEDDIWYPDNLEDQDGIFVGYADITDLVRKAGEGEYTVADMALLEGIGGSVGFYGGWGMVIIYENPLMDQRDIVVFDGFTYVASYLNSDYFLELSGFSAVETGQVNLKMGLMAGEGDRGGTGDYFEIEQGVDTGEFTRLQHEGNDTFNFFNASIQTEGNARNPDLVNNTGFDIAIFDVPNENNLTIKNNQSQTRFRYGSVIDTYAIFNLTFAIDANQPILEATNHLLSQHEEENEIFAIETGESMEFKVEIRNRGQVDINEGKVVIPLPINTKLGIVESEFYLEPNSAGTPFYDPEEGANGALVWELGYLPVPNNPGDILAAMTYTILAGDNCSIYPGFQCVFNMAVSGEISGVNSDTGLPIVGIKFIKNQVETVDCLANSINSPFLFIMGQSSTSEPNCPETTPLAFSFCNFNGDYIPISKVQNSFPAGTRFYNNSPDEDQAIEFTLNHPFPKIDEQIDYYAYLEEETICYQQFFITHQSMKAEIQLVLNENGSALSCNGASVGQLLAHVEGGSPPYSFQWDDPNATTDSLVSQLPAGNYTVTILDSESCLASATITLEEPAPMEIAIDNSSILELNCNGNLEGRIDIQVSGGSLPLSTSLIKVNEDGTQEDLDHYFNADRRDFVFDDLDAGNYLITVNDAQQCQQKIPVEISDALPLSLSSSITPAVDCQKTNSGRIELAIEGGTAPYKIQWSNGALGLIVENLPVGIYTAEVYDAKNCFQSASFELEEILPLEIYVTTSTEVECNIDGVISTFVLSVAGGAPPYQIEWNGGNVQDGGLVMVTEDAGTYRVSVKDTNVCTAVEEMVVLPNHLTTDFEYHAASFDVYGANLVNYPINFTPTTSRETVTHEWDFGDGNFSHESDPFHTYGAEGNYQVKLTVSDIFGCKRETIKQIKIEEAFILMPNAFTPDGDGLNDRFFPEFNYIQKLEFWIFNKWGETLFYTADNTDKGWDGTYRGEAVTAGNYVFKLVYETPDGRTKELTNVFLLIR